MNAPTVYRYDKWTGEFVGTELAVQSPLDEPGVWLYPANSTTQPPPQVDNGLVAVWVDESWQTVEDHRGKTIYKGQSSATVETIGPVPDGWSLDPPEPSNEPFIPTSVLLWQARAVLDTHGLLQQVDTLIEASGSAANKAAWHYAPAIRRDSQLVNWAAGQIGLTSEQVDQMFLEASQIEV
jgi:hypothetical protein